MSQRPRLISTVERAMKVSEDIYANNGDILFNKFCQHSSEHLRVHIVKMHIKSVKH